MGSIKRKAKSFWDRMLACWAMSLRGCLGIDWAVHSRFSIRGELG